MDNKEELKEAFWIVAMACIGLLVIVDLHLSSTVMGEYLETGSATIPFSFWAFVALTLAVSAVIPMLLKDSKSMELRVIAVLLTSIAPAVATIFIALNLWQVTHA